MRMFGFPSFEESNFIYCFICHKSKR